MSAEREHTCFSGLPFRAQLLQSHLTLCNCRDCSSSVHGILQVRILEWVAMPPSRGSSYPGIELESLMSPALADRLFTTSATWEAPFRRPSPQEKQTDMPVRGHLGLTVLPGTSECPREHGHSKLTPNSPWRAGSQCLKPATHLTRSFYPRIHILTTGNFWGRFLKDLN